MKPRQLTVECSGTRTQNQKQCNNNPPNTLVWHQNFFAQLLFVYNHLSNLKWPPLSLLDVFAHHIVNRCVITYHLHFHGLPCLTGSPPLRLCPIAKQHCLWSSMARVHWDTTCIQPSLSGLVTCQCAQLIATTRHVSIVPEGGAKHAFPTTPLLTRTSCRTLGQRLKLP